MNTSLSFRRYSFEHRTANCTRIRKSTAQGSPKLHTVQYSTRIHKLPCVIHHILQHVRYFIWGLCVFWGVKRYSMAEVKRRFRRTCCFHHLCPGGVKFLWNVGKVPHEVHVSHCSDSLKFHSSHVFQVCFFCMSRIIQVHLPQLSPYRTSLSCLSCFSGSVLSLRCKNELLMWRTLPSARWWHIVGD